MRKKSTRTCLECGGRMRYETRDDVIAYKGHTRTLPTTGWWCISCDEAILDGEALMSSEKAFVQLRAEVDQILLPEEVAAVRQKLGISQREAGKLLGGGPRAFQKYETGKVPVSTPMNNLLRLLANDPKRLQELRLTERKRRRTMKPPGRKKRAS